MLITGSTRIWLNRKKLLFRMKNCSTGACTKKRLKRLKRLKIEKQFLSFQSDSLFFQNFVILNLNINLQLENNMKNPSHFIGCPGVLNFGMGFVVTLYAAVGFLGYLKYGSATEGSITLNLPVEDM